MNNFFLNSFINAKSGCIKCQYLKAGENPMGWRFLNWKNFAEKSKHFDSFKVYIIECWDENERFYKIGRTFNKINLRFSGNKTMPYNFRIIKIFEGESEEIYKLENGLKKENKEFKYLPTKKFGGRYECFSQLKQTHESTMQQD